MLLLIDNYDSFVHNLARYCRELGCETRVVRNDALKVNEVANLKPDAIVISPGPCGPSEAGISEDLIRANLGIPILGVCLGHQAIASALGGEIIRAPRPVHGQTCLVQHSSDGIFEGVPNPMHVMRYHSLIVDETTLPDELEITARTDQGIPMALRHRNAPIVGVQFHPESILTERGHLLLRNFLSRANIATHNEPANELTSEIAESLWEQDFESGSNVAPNQ